MAGDQLSMFTFCPACSGQRVYLPHQVAPVEVWRLPDGRCLVNFWDGLRAAVWVELSEEGRRWLAGELLKGLDAATGRGADALPAQSDTDVPRSLTRTNTDEEATQPEYSTGVL